MFLKTLALGALVSVATTSCMTTYDQYGRPVQSVDPALAVAGVAAAGVAGYAIGQNNSNHNDYYYHGGYRRYHHPAPYYHGGYHAPRYHGYHGYHH